MKTLSKTQKAKKNIVTSLLCQGVIFLSGLLIPRWLIGAFGSELYGMTTSIGGFLAYISLMEAGIGAVSRAALYKALNTKNSAEISKVVLETRAYFRKIAFVFIFYVLFVALFYDRISHNTTADFWVTFSLVIVIAISQFAEYFIGLSCSLLLQADQRMYVNNALKMGTYVLNAVCIFLLIKVWKCTSIVIVKAFSSLIFVIRPIFLSFYVKKAYNIQKVNGIQKGALQQKGYALGQHIAYTLHNNTDTSVLTIFAGTSYVSVYSVYHMVISQIVGIASSFTGDMEAIFGNYLANNETSRLRDVLGYYETLISLLPLTLLAITSVMIIPFVQLYTQGIADVEYIYPSFAFMLIIASSLFVLRQPYHKMVMAAGHFKQTQWAGYGEAILNIAVSIILVVIMPGNLKLLAVAIGTVIATSFRMVYYVFYISKNLCERSLAVFVKRFFFDGLIFAIIYTIGNQINRLFNIDSYIKWCEAGVLISIFAFTITILINIMFYKHNVWMIMQMIYKRRTKL